MKIAIIGGGFTGLTAAYYLAKEGYEITIFEKEKELGGLAAGFKNERWSWSLEKSYHHFFSNDLDVLNFAKEIGFKDIFFQSPITASLYNDGSNEIFPLDTPQDLLKFPLLSLLDRIRVGFVLLFFKLVPFLPFLEKQTSEDFLKKTMGLKAWNILWEQLFREKFGKNAGNILASFIWARIKKRTKKLGYVRGGYQTLVDYLVLKNEEQGVLIKTGKIINKIEKVKNYYLIDDQKYDKVLSTIASPLLAKTTEKVFPKKYLEALKNINYSSALTVVLEMNGLPVNKIYWLNIASKKIPFMVFVQHTNFINKENYNNQDIVYLGNYLSLDDDLLKKTDKQITDYYITALRNCFSEFEFKISNSYVFRQQFAQPIFDNEFLKNKPYFITPAMNFYIANLEMTYPYDRGVNYAVAIGKKVSNMIINSSE